MDEPHPEADKQSDPLALPSPEKLKEIAAKQDAQAQKIRERRAAQAHARASVATERRTNAAELIQRNYRGYRQRRQMQGYALDPSTRWLEKVGRCDNDLLTRPLTDTSLKAKYHCATQPRSRAEHHASLGANANPTLARWKRVGAVVRRADSDDTSASEGDQQSRLKKAEREKYARRMGLEYFLEMVDHNHRYGSNLRRYHQEWKNSETKENFFYWLDYGEGKELDLEDRPRSRLDTEFVRYLSREERQHYLVHINKEDGLFYWAKDGRPVSTSTEFKDSINGIVPADDSTPTWREVSTGQKPEPSPPSSSSSSSDDSSSLHSTGSHPDPTEYPNTSLHTAKGLHKLHHLTTSTLMNHLLRTATTKKNTWIFVADTSFRLYIGIKQSGAFQHSSFLHGSRISAAGILKIKRGQLRKLSPLSGHYAPPLRNFREFVRSLKEAGADLSRCSISRAYAVLLGLEGYLGVKRQVKSVEKRVIGGLIHPGDEKRKVKDDGEDGDGKGSRGGSLAAERRQSRQTEEREAQERKRDRRWSVRFRKRLSGAGGDGRQADADAALQPGSLVKDGQGGVEVKKA
ncbi:hypothetical protein D0861_06808 [Hortaea werneckii]|uniref:IQ domain-containing protein IQM6 n=1 Tax=Hortaea werneckii TaxID=91943 RepID=A0A3M7F810_HORWE|nr:hypothetical protein D0861_06808 [Hortaea werneckii]